MRRIINHNLFIAFLLNCFLFVISLFLLNPCYKGDTDIYFLYTLSGGYGNSPSALLHYYWGAHPILGGLIASLFFYFPGLNWYSFFLILFHFICCLTLSISFLDSFKRPFAIVAFTIFFLFIESRLLLGFTYSGAAVIGAISGSVSLLVYFANKKQTNERYPKIIFFFSFLILVAGLIRIHYIALFGVLALWIGIFILSRAHLIKFLKIQLILGLLLLVFFQGQKYYYQIKTPQWKQEEQFRTLYFHIANHKRKKPSLMNDDLEKLKDELITISFFGDRNLINYSALKEFSERNVRVFNLEDGNFKSFNWLFMELRVYLLLLGGAVILFIGGNFKRVSRFIYMSFFSVFVYFLMCLFFKSTEIIFLAVSAAVLISAIFCLADISLQKLSIITGSLLIGLSCLWMIVRIIKEDRQNKLEISYARGVLNELNSRPDVLFVDAGTRFNLHLAIWDLPQKYPIRNLIYNELFISNSYNFQLRRYGVTDLMKDLPMRDNIYVVGKKASILIDYYRLLHHQKVIARKVPGFTYIDAYRITTDNNK